LSPAIPPSWFSDCVPVALICDPSQVNLGVRGMSSLVAPMKSVGRGQGEARSGLDGELGASNGSKPADGLSRSRRLQPLSYPKVNSGSTTRRGVLAASAAYVS